MKIAGEEREEEVFLFGQKGEILFSEDSEKGYDLTQRMREQLVTSPTTQLNQVDKSIKFMGSTGHITTSNFVNNSQMKTTF